MNLLLLGSSLTASAARFLSAFMAPSPSSLAATVSVNSAISSNKINLLCNETTSPCLTSQDAQQLLYREGGDSFVLVN